MISVNKNYFEFLYIIGRGGFGKVWKVKLKKTNEYFALKEMSKTKIIDRRSEISIMSERTLLSKLNNPFIVNMYFAFQDFSNLYLVMDLLSGGDLRYQLSKKKKFTEKETKFFISNIIIALEYIHSKNIIHRDIKPENLVLELSGYLRITDFGIAKINEKDNSSETSGTPGYMAPEVILVQNHSFTSDFFALGVIGYEFMLGHRPYIGRSRKEIKELIIYKQARLNEGEIPYSWSLESADFINKLLKRKPNKRLGFNGIKELKSHIWMRDINWNALKRKELVAPFIPNPNKENFDKKYCENIEEVGRETLSRYKEYKKSDLFLDAFNGYTFINISYIKTKIKKSKIKEEIEKKLSDTYNENNNNINENDKNEKNKISFLNNTQHSRMKKNNSMVFGDSLYISLGADKNMNSLNSQKFNFDIKLNPRNKSTRNSIINIVNYDSKKDTLKKKTVDNSIHSVKNRFNYLNNSSNFLMKKESQKYSNKNREKEKLRIKALKISEKLKELEKKKLYHEFNLYKESNKKRMNKSNSMKMLNLNIGVKMNYNYDKNRTSKNKNELKIKNSNNMKTMSKKRVIFNNNQKVKKTTRNKSSKERKISPKKNDIIQKISVDKNNKYNSLVLNHYNDIKNEENQKIENNKNINNEYSGSTAKQNSEIKILNKDNEIKNLLVENLNKKNNNHNHNLDDFNIKEFEKENYNEPRSKVMLWIQKSLPINQYESNNINQNNNNDKIIQINHKEINDKINNKNNKTEEIPYYQLPIRNSVNEQNKTINRKRLEIIKLINNNKNLDKIRAVSQSKIINSLNQKNNYKTTKIDTKEKCNIKKIINKKQYKSPGHSKKNLNTKNKNYSKSNRVIKSSSSMKSLKPNSPKNTFLVFNTININLGNHHKEQKLTQTPNSQIMRNINSSLKEACIRNNFIFDSLPSFLKKEKEKYKIK